MASKAAGSSAKSSQAGAASASGQPAQVTPQGRGSWRQGVLLPALASSLLLWAAFAPLNWSVLAWLAPVGWLLVVARDQPVGRGGYVALWISGCLFWLAILQGIRLAFWPLYFGWLALSLYLAVYTPVFVAVARCLYWRWRLPLVLAAPIAWVGMEWIRSHLITGYAGNTLAHSQVHTPRLVQLADQLGGGGVSFVMLAVSSGALQAAVQLHSRQPKRARGPLVAATLMFVLLIGYGSWRLAQGQRLLAQRPALLRAMLVQENTPTIFEFDPERNQLAWTRYLEQTRRGVEQLGVPDVVLWPESTFTANEPIMRAELTDGPPPELVAEGVDQAFLMEQVAKFERIFDFKVAQLLSAASRSPAANSNTAASQLSAPGSLPPSPPDEQATAQPSQRPYLVVGSDIWSYKSDSVERFNAALFISPEGKLLDWYSKMHLVMFGEYIPLGSSLKWLGDLFGLAGLTPGTQFKCFRIGDVCLAPNICFESMVPHLLTRQVRELTRSGSPPDILVNVTNDSWFRGSSALDHHLASSILSAVENRRPMLVAGNTGLSAHIDGVGQLVQVTSRLEATAILAEPRRDGRGGLVQAVGYPLSWICAFVSGLAGIAWLARRFRNPPG